MDLQALSRKGALLVLAALSREHPRALSASEFVAASGTDVNTAKRLREALHLTGIIEAKIVREQGAVIELEISLTPYGRPIADFALAMGEYIEKNESARGLATKGR